MPANDDVRWLPVRWHRHLVRRRRQPGYTGKVSLAGEAKLFVSGTIYAPKALVNIEGNAAASWNGADCLSGSATQVASVRIISWKWDIGGTGDLCMPYNPALLYRFTYQGLVH